LKNVLGSRRFKGSTGLQGRKGGKMNILPDVHRAEANYPRKLKQLKSMQSGLFLLNDQEVQSVKQLFNITDLEKKGSRNLGNTGITFYIADNKYYIKK
jgi:hypothetical protein